MIGFIGTKTVERKLQIVQEFSLCRYLMSNGRVERFPLNHIYVCVCVCQEMDELKERRALETGWLSVWKRVENQCFLV